jgi:uroporphyrinogen-III synthase
LSDSSVETDLPLVGRRILITRAVHQAGKLSDGLRALGAEPVEVPVLEIRPPDSLEPLDNALRKINSFNWLILTSVNTVNAVAARFASLGVDFSAIELLSVAAVGSATAEAARKVGFRVTVVPDSYQAESLVAALGTSVAGKKVLFARAKITRNVIPEALSKIASDLVVVDAYQTVLPAESQNLLAQAMQSGLDAATFTSSSSVRNLAEIANEVGIGFPLTGIPAVSIGQVTSATLRELGWEPAAEAETSDIPRLIDAVVKVLSR